MDPTSDARYQCRGAFAEQTPTAREHTSVEINHLFPDHRAQGRTTDLGTALMARTHPAMTQFTPCRPLEDGEFSKTMSQGQAIQGNESPEYGDVLMSKGLRML